MKQHFTFFISKFHNFIFIINDTIALYTILFYSHKDFDQDVCLYGCRIFDNHQKFKWQKIQTEKKMFLRFLFRWNCSLLAALVYSYIFFCFQYRHCRKTLSLDIMKCRKGWYMLSIFMKFYYRIANFYNNINI